MRGGCSGWRDATTQATLTGRVPILQWNRVPSARPVRDPTPKRSNVAADKEPSKKRRKPGRTGKAIGLAAAAAAAAVVPEAAEVVVQKTELRETEQKLAPEPIVPEPPRYEYTKPRPLKTIGDLLREALTRQSNQPKG